VHSNDGMDSLAEVCTSECFLVCYFTVSYNMQSHFSFLYSYLAQSEQTLLMFYSSICRKTFCCFQKHFGSL